MLILPAFLWQSFSIFNWLLLPFIIASIASGRAVSRLAASLPFRPLFAFILFIVLIQMQ